MSDESYYFAASTTQPDFFGTPFPAPGVRVQIDPAAVAAFGNPRRWPEPLLPSWTRQGLLVYRDPRSVMTYPCRLWRVHRPEDPFSLNPTNSTRLRCDAFSVIEELPSWQIFGPHGEAVAGLIHEVGQLNQGRVDVIADLDSDQETRVRRDFLDRWRRSRSDDFNLPEPTGWAGLHVATALNLAAAHTGQHLFGWIDYADYWPILADPSWREAHSAAIAKMTAIGAPELLEDHEVAILTARWDAVSSDDFV